MDGCYCLREYGVFICFLIFLFDFDLLFCVDLFIGNKSIGNELCKRKIFKSKGICWVYDVVGGVFV